MRILIIDDSKEDRNLIINHIKNIKKDVQVDQSNCLKDGLEKISSNDYTTILLDLALPEADGIETIETVLTHVKQHNKKAQIIILTGIEDYSIGRKAWQLGIKEFLIKDEIQAKDLSRALTFGLLDKQSIAI